LQHPSIPPAYGADPLFASAKAPLRGPRMARKAPQTPLDRVGHEGGYEHLPVFGRPLIGQKLTPAPVNEVVWEPVVEESKPAEAVEDTAQRTT
jgi:hypothetical protein